MIHVLSYSPQHGVAASQRLHRRAPVVMTASPMRQAGVSLIELLVGITIGLLTVAVALAALMVSRGVTGTVSEATTLQQQAAYAFRVIGQQLRQAGSMELDLGLPIVATGSTAPAADGAYTRVAFDPNNRFNRKTDTVSGNDTSSDTQAKLLTGFQNVEETLYKNPPEKNQDAVGKQLKNCIGENPGALTTNPVIRSQFRLKNNELLCGSANNSSGSQAIIQNVSDFQVRYLKQTNVGGTPSIQIVNAAAVGSDWSKIFAVEVCLDLVGTERIDTAGAKYTQCDGTQADLNNRLHLVFRNTFQIRSQGSV